MTLSPPCTMPVGSPTSRRLSLHSKQVGCIPSFSMGSPRPINYRPGRFALYIAPFVHYRGFLPPRPQCDNVYQSDAEPLRRYRACYFRLILKALSSKCVDK
ncbi:hypothetical protein AB1N83_009684 [Pleurotus pulmonarius]